MSPIAAKSRYQYGKNERITHKQPQQVGWGAPELMGQVDASENRWQRDHYTRAIECNHKTGEGRIW